jgi:uncharacterized membrane protein YphA (DoxX/SURF4 family)
LWVVQVLLAVSFAMGGLMKLTSPVADIAVEAPWAAEIPVALLRFIGAAEFAGALGVLLPALTRIKPGLTALAAAGLSLIMIFAFVFHIVRGEAAATPVNVIFAGFAAFVAWGRFRKAPIQPR